VDALDRALAGELTLNATNPEQSIFLAALELPTAAERAAYLKGACGADLALIANVQELLAAHAMGDDFLDHPPPNATVDEQPVTERPGTVIGPYKLLEQIGEGGFGLVFMAEQQQPLRRKVALKVIKPGMDSKHVIGRFEAERQDLALMDHPNIARVLDAGTTDTGRPYFVMELVKGIPITQFCDESRLTTRERLELFVQVCQAVQHAHQKGIIHRDLKPSNVLLTLLDGTPATKVIDFGIAKALGQQLTEKTLFTGFAQMVGTPLYMSPEQAGLSGRDVDTRSDLYSLGVLLYELLTGTTPFDKERLQESAYEEILRIIREEEPPRPSTRITTQGQAAETVSTQRQSDPKRLSRLLAGELDWIVMKTLEKDRNRRYESASALAADVQRHLNQEPVQACPPSVGYRLKKLARRNKGKLAVGACALIVLAILAAGLGWNLRDRQARRTDAEARVVEALEVAEPRLLQGNPYDRELVSAARKAEAQLAGGMVREQLRHQVVQLLADLKMLEKLEEIGVMWDNTADAAYAQAFREYGIDVEALGVQEAAAEIRQRAIGLPLAIALDKWAGDRKRAGGTNWKQLLEVAREVDPDAWRCAIREARASGRKEDLKTLVASGPISKLPATTLVALASLFAKEGGSTAQLIVAALREAQHRDPADFRVNVRLAGFLADEVKPPQVDEAVGFYRAALALRPQSYLVRLNLSAVLCENNRLDEGIVYCKEAIDLRPEVSGAYQNLGSALFDKGQVDEAIAAYRQAIRYGKQWAHLHHMLGRALAAKGRFDEAIAAYNEAIHVKQDFATAHIDLGNALDAKGRHDEAIACYREAIRHDKGNAVAHSNLGDALREKGQLDEAIACCRQAIFLKTDFALAHSNLGLALRDKGLLDEAIAEFREAIGKGFVEAHLYLAHALSDKGDLDGAIAVCQDAIHIKKDFAEAYCMLGIMLRRKTQFVEALGHYRRAHELGSKLPDWHDRSAQFVRDAERLVALDQKLPAFLEAKAKPADVAECLGLAEICFYKELFAATCRFFAEAFAADAKLELDHRYNAACAAALAGCGKGKDSPVGEAERACLRRQALAWLRADLKARGQQLENEGDKARPVVRKLMQHWQRDPDFNGVRGPEPLARLPEGERQQWQELWKDVAALGQRAAEPPKAENPGRP
jgi:serine/threonine protein kinase/Flp pilus assembly protein TadD